MNENIWIQDARRRHEDVAAAMQDARDRDRRTPPGDVVAPGPLFGAVVLGLAAGAPPVALGVGVVVAIGLGEVIRRWRRFARPAARTRREVLTWSLGHTSR